jgi:thiamine-phosphate pyrophosphorylase
VSEVRRFDTQLRIGVSTHSLSQLQAALREAPGYVAFGPVFATDSKENADNVQGLPRLLEAAAMTRAARVPLVAIGGIGLQRVPDLVGHVAAVALISGLCPLPQQCNDASQPWRDITERAVAIQTAFVGRY